MKILKSALIVLLCFAVALLPGCKYLGTFSGGNTELKIGVEGIEGIFNPFYSESEADLEIVSQMFRPVQIKGTDNSLINQSGSISYEFDGENRVKYTVSINDDMFFSDGTHITIDDIISFYHFIADASYDGIYKDWYLNDIVGVKEYYFDDNKFSESISDIEADVAEKYTLTTISVEDYSKYLVSTKLEGKYAGIDSKAPSGVTWREYISGFGYYDEINAAAEKNTDEAWLKLVADIEAENNPNAYNPETWYRELLYKNYLKDNYSDGIDVTAISGIKKINDYTCSVLFNSRNINAVSEINALIIPRSSYATDYIKGSADKIKEIKSFTVGSGPYIIAENSESEVKMSANEFYEEECGFRTLKFIDVASSGDSLSDSVASGRVDVINTPVNLENYNRIKDAPVQHFVNNSDYYISMFYNTRTLDLNARIALMSICTPDNAVDGLVGSYYTRLFSPLSIRFNEYPEKNDKAYYDENSFSIYSKLSQTPLGNLTAYYAGDESDLEYTFLITYKDILSKKGINLELLVADEETVNAAIISGKADIWLEKVYDGATCDKYEYYNSLGAVNKTGLKSDEIDVLTSNIRTAVGFADKSQMTEKLLELVMDQAVEWPLYQLQTMTVYNTEKISPESFAEVNRADGYTYYIPYLKPAE